MFSPGLVAKPNRQMKSVPRATAGDELAAAHPAHVLAHGESRGDGDHPRMHDGVLVDVVEVERVRHGGVHLSGVRRGDPVAPPQDAALRGAPPLEHQIPHLGHAGFARPAQGDPEEVEHLVLGDLHDFWRQILIPDVPEVGDKRLCGVGSGIEGGWRLS